MQILRITLSSTLCVYRGEPQVCMSHSAAYRNIKRHKQYKWTEYAHCRCEGDSGGVVHWSSMWQDSPPIDENPRCSTTPALKTKMGWWIGMLDMWQENMRLSAAAAAEPRDDRQL